MSPEDANKLLFKHDRELNGILETQRSIADTLKEFKELHKETSDNNKAVIKELHEIQITLREFHFVKDDFEERISDIEKEHKDISAADLARRISVIEKEHEGILNSKRKWYEYFLQNIFGAVLVYLLMHLFGKDFAQFNNK